MARDIQEPAGDLTVGDGLGTTVDRGAGSRGAYRLQSQADPRQAQCEPLLSGAKLEGALAGSGGDRHLEGVVGATRVQELDAFQHECRRGQSPRPGGLVGRVVGHHHAPPVCARFVQDHGEDPVGEGRLSRREFAAANVQARTVQDRLPGCEKRRAGAGRKSQCLGLQRERLQNDPETLAAPAPVVLTVQRKPSTDRVKPQAVRYQWPPGRRLDVAQL